jgi:hypothetical protein
MLSLEATERDAGVSCRFRISCLQNSWDGKQSGKDCDDKEMCCDLVSLSNRVPIFSVSHGFSYQCSGRVDMGMCAARMVVDTCHCLDELLTGHQLYPNVLCSE